MVVAPMSRSFRLQRRIALATVLIGCVLGFSPMARANEASAELRRKGNDAMDRLDYAEALAEYTKALALDPSDVAVFYNIGRVQQAREDFVAALDALESFRDNAEPDLRSRLPKLDELILDVRRRVTTLRVRCSVDAPDAQLFVGGRQVAPSCGTESIEVRANAPKQGMTLEVRVQSSRFRSETRQVSVADGDAVIAVDLALAPRTNSGLLKVRTTPPGAELWIDGVRRGNPPLELPLSAGAHRVQAKLDGYHDVDTPVLVEADGIKELDIPLGKAIPLTSRWWFWTAVGAGVFASAGVVTYLLVKDTERPAGSGSLGQIAAPLVKF